MKTPHMQPEDWAWMRQRIGASGIGLAVLLGLGAVLQSGTRKPGPGSTSLAKETVVEKEAFVDSASMPPSIDAPTPGKIGTTRGVSIPPSDWRRTSRGWEHIGTWPTVENTTLKPSLAELVRTQEAKEPAWMKLAFGKLQRVPPLVFALLQIIAIGFICQLGRRRAS